MPYPPHDGDKLRLYYFLKYLKSKGHKIDLFCLTRVKEDLVHAESLRPLCRSIHVQHLTDLDLFFNVLAGFAVGESLNVMSYFSPELREKLKEYAASDAGKKIDVIFCHRLRMVPYAFRYYLKYVNRLMLPAHRARKIEIDIDESLALAKKPVVVDLTDSLISYTGQLKKQKSARFSRRTAAWSDHFFLKKEEVEWSGMTAKAIVVAQPDADVLMTNGLAKNKVTVIPNGVDLKSLYIKGKSVYPAKAKVVCFVGNMGYAPNEEGALWFIKNVWPQVKAAVPEAVFAAVGGTPRKVLREYHNGYDLLVTGWVPHVEPYLLGAQLSIAPLRFAGGMQNKVALSLGLAVPVVATSAATGWLPKASRSLVNVADDANGFADEVIAILKNPKKAKAQAAKGKKFVSKNYQWNVAGKQLEEVLRKAAGKGWS